MCSHDTQLFFLLCSRIVWDLQQLRDSARQYVQAGMPASARRDTAVARLAPNVYGRRLSATLLSTDTSASVQAAVANCCSLRVGCCRNVRMNPAPDVTLSLRTAVLTAPSKDAHEMNMVVDSGRNENVQQVFELSHCGRVLVATEVHGSVPMIGR